MADTTSTIVAAPRPLVSPSLLTSIDQEELQTDLNESGRLPSSETMDAAKDLCSRGADYFNCRTMPHGGAVLFPTVMATLALCASLADDGCDYARLRGAAVQMLTGSSAVPFVDCGMSAYRVPDFYPSENAWRVVYSDACRPYEYMNLLADTSWVAAEWLRFFGLVLGMTTASFLWTSTCLTLRPNYWQGAGIGAALACLCQMCSFVWFYTKLCHTSTTNFEDFESGREVELDARHDNPSSCTLFFGSKCAITSCVFWGFASALVLVREYPTPVPKLIVHDEGLPITGGTTEAALKQQPVKGGRRMLTARSMGKKAVGGAKGKKMSARSQELTASISTAHSSQHSVPSSSGQLSSSQRSLPWVSGTPYAASDGGGSGGGNVRASLRTSMRPSSGDAANHRQMMVGAHGSGDQLSGSQFSAVSFA